VATLIVPKTVNYLCRYFTEPKIGVSDFFIYGLIFHSKLFFFLSLEKHEHLACWRYETAKGRRTKVTYGADGKKAGTDGKDNHRWVNYASALEAAKSQGYDGVGLVILPGSAPATFT
jgi:hypothetical protein